MEESWETGFSQYPDMDYAQEFRGCRTMMNLEEEVDEEFLGNIVEKPDPVRSEIISSSQRDETENNDHLLSPRAFVLSFDNSKVEPIITKQDEHTTLKHRFLSKRIRARHNAEPMSKKKRRSLE
ncbi:hypothetical protein QN277_029452 [Acacia crassicarpa]|uniref:Uncharacterized protein n=1 Tax=Acacia crassicarpa TaxID=499986 RepID=A0AAE1J9L0_9FABA|nr:hypothetical protein QN277_029452 [Acacia crassicarpa]